MRHSVQRRRALPLARRGECFPLSQQSAGAAPRDFVRLSAMHVGSQQSKESRCAAAACAPVCLPGRVLSHIATQRGAAPPPGSAPAAGASARSAGAAGRARGRPARPPRARPGAQGAAHERRPRPPHREGGKSGPCSGSTTAQPGAPGTPRAPCRPCTAAGSARRHLRAYANSLTQQLLRPRRDPRGSGRRAVACAPTVQKESLGLTRPTSSCCGQWRHIRSGREVA